MRYTILFVIVQLFAFSILPKSANASTIVMHKQIQTAHSEIHFIDLIAEINLDDEDELSYTYLQNFFYSNTFESNCSLNIIPVFSEIKKSFQYHYKTNIETQVWHCTFLI